MASIQYCTHGVPLPATDCPDCVNDKQLAGGIESPEGTAPAREEVPAARVASITVHSRAMVLEPMPKPRSQVVQCPHCQGKLTLKKEA